MGNKVQDNFYNCWAEINSAHLINNFNNFKMKLRKNCKILAVVKANAYGHGLVEIAKILSQNKVDYFGVANINEGIKLRENGINEPILIFGYTNPKCVESLIRFDLTQTVFSSDYAKELSKYCNNKKTLKVHIKLNTGMNRVGFDTSKTSSINDVYDICKSKKLSVNGIYTHFYNAEKPSEPDTKIQFRRFIDFIENVEKKGFKFAIKHCCNSAAAIYFPEMQLDMVRVGALLYGINIPNTIHVDEIMCLKAKIEQVFTVKKGCSVGYDASFIAKKNMTIATISAGYADGVLRELNRSLKVCVNGSFCTVVGLICMDQFMIDVADVSCKEGDEVIIFGNGGQSINVLSKKIKMQTRELMCLISNRAGRFYK